MSKVALLWFVYAMTDSALKMSLIGVLQTIPPLVFGPLAGVLLDRLDKRRAMQSRRNEARDNGKENWLLIKEQDAEARRGKAGEIVESLTESVESGRGLNEIAIAGARVWHSNRTSSNSEPRGVSPEVTTQKVKHRPSVKPSRLTDVEASKLPGAVKARQPDWIAPQLATLVDRMPTDDNWLHEEASTQIPVRR